MATIASRRSIEMQESIENLHGVERKDSKSVLPPEEVEAQNKIMELLKHRGYTVWRMSDEQVREAVPALRFSDEQSRKAAAKVFGKMGPAASSAVGNQLRNEDPGVRAVAAEIIGYMGKKTGEQFLENLVELLTDQDCIVRRAGVAALGSLSELVQGKAKDVARLLKDPDTDVRRLAVEALRRIEPTDQSHLQAVLDLLQDPAWTVRRSAVETLGSMPDAAGAHSAKIAALFNDSEWLVRGAAAQAIGSLGLEGAKHAPELQELLTDKEWFVRNVAAEALYSLGPAGCKLLEIHHEGMRSSAAEQLASRFHPPKNEVVIESGLAEDDKESNNRLKNPQGRRARTVSNRSAQKAVYSHSCIGDAVNRDVAAANFQQEINKSTFGTVLE